MPPWKKSAAEPSISRKEPALSLIRPTRTVGTRVKPRGLGTTRSHSPIRRLIPLPAADTKLLTLPAGLAGWTYSASTGWYTWRYTPGLDPKSKALCGGDFPEMMRFRLARYNQIRNGGVTPTREFQVLAEGKFDRFSRVHELKGSSKPLFNDALSDYGEGLSEFLRGPAQEIQGRVHSNGPLFFKPGSSLRISGVVADKSYRLADGSILPAGGVFPGSHSVTTASTIVADRDAWGRARGNGSTVNISVRRNSGKHRNISIGSTANGSAPRTPGGTTPLKAISRGSITLFKTAPPQ